MKRNWVAFWLSGLVLVPWAFFVHRFWFLCDDAFISFRFARNWALGHGLRYNLGEHVPVEGFSNFLWVSIGALVECLGGDQPEWMPRISVVFAVLLAFWFVRTLLCLQLALWLTLVVSTALMVFPPLAVWSTSGLETMSFAFFFFVAVERLFLRPGGPAPLCAAVAAIFLSLSRPEGCLWVLGLAVLFAFTTWRKQRRSWGPWLVFAGVWAVGFGIYFWWRYSLFGELVPNTVAAKSMDPRSALGPGSRYVVVYLLTFLTPLLLLAAVPALIWQPEPNRRLAAGLCCLGPIAFSILAGGDFMTSGRLLLPSVPLQFVCLGLLARTLWERGPAGKGLTAVLLIGVLIFSSLPAFNVHAVPEDWRQRFHFRTNSKVFRSEYEQWEFMKAHAVKWSVLGKALKQHSQAGESLIAGAIGAVGFYSDLYIYDKYGLVTKKVAEKATKRRRSPGHQSVPPEFFLEDEPTYGAAKLLYTLRPDVAVPREAEKWRDDELAQEYFPEFEVLDEKTEDGLYQVLFVLRRKKAEETWVRAWMRFDRKVRNKLKDDDF